MSARLVSIPAAEYHADPCESPSLSTGTIKIMRAKSPKHAWAAHPKNPARREFEKEDKFDLGTAAHAVLLEGDTSRIVSVVADDWRTNAAKAKRDEARAAGKVALLERQHESVLKMVEAAFKYIVTSEIADDWRAAASEQSVLWRDDETGIWLRARPDRLSNDHIVCIDYKTTEDASPSAFVRTIAALDYHVQDALYRRSQRALGVPEPKFVFLAQETHWPYECALYGCDPAMQAAGNATVEWAMRTWARCLATGEWPGYGPRVRLAEPPAWLMAESADVEDVGAMLEREMT